MKWIFKKEKINKYVQFRRTKETDIEKEIKENNSASKNENQGANKTQQIRDKLRMRQKNYKARKQQLK